MVLLASSYDQSRFLKAADLEREKKFRIKSVTEEEVGADAQKEKKLVVWFTNDNRGLVLNKTNNRTIRGAFGDPINGWINKIIIIFPTHVDMRGKLTPALRVRIPPPKQAATTAPAAAAPPAAPPQQAATTAPAATTPPPQQATTAVPASAVPPPQQVATAAPAASTPPVKRAPSGNGAAAAAPSPPQTAATAVADPELEDEPPKSLSEELDDEIPFN
jgi:hypothetical protein